ncbi:DUF2911 domain-containing protein [Fulvivirga sedimenti]|uniref:DUF2911 domain-containing protein n=1 Tax=Fulvivirga sedimenti TaxID=2879465 RepID=A0A9X1L2N9_9BACT|nr:DUF2911 domain-containing protein [Fulvivirga sedimenti]MCA6078391.1 DUF2911 domain-containing protein [Fulvivirga sedimenti]
MKKLVIILGILIAVIVISMVALRQYTKSFSPEDTATIDMGEVSVTVHYCRPLVGDREIFGELVPYGEVWRTGANEATVFRSTSDLQIGENILPAGEYSVFTVPGPENWDVIFNSETGQWGISVINGGKANRKEKNDILTTTVPAITTDEFFEQFTISLEGMSGEIDLIIMWENTMVVVPMNIVTP